MAIYVGSKSAGTTGTAKPEPHCDACTYLTLHHITSMLMLTVDDQLDDPRDISLEEAAKASEDFDQAEELKSQVQDRWCLGGTASTELPQSWDYPAH